MVRIGSFGYRRMYAEGGEREKEKISTFAYPFYWEGKLGTGKAFNQSGIKPAWLTSSWAASIRYQPVLHPPDEVSIISDLETFS